MNHELNKDTAYNFINVNINHNSSFGQAPSDAAVEIRYDQPILKDPSLYFLSIGRICFPSYSIPLLVPTMQVGSDYSDNITAYEVSMQYKETVTSSNVIWIPSTSANGPYLGTVLQALRTDNPYYYCYDPFNFCAMINNALENCLDTLKFDFAELADAENPYFYYDNLNKSLVFSCTKAFYDQTLTDPIYIYFNNQLTPLLNGFRFFEQAVSQTPLNNILFIQNTYDNNDPVDNTKYLIRPNATDFSYWSPVSALQLVTTLGINPESAAPVNFSYGQVSPLQAAQNNQQTIIPQQLLTDFEIDYQDPTTLNSIFVYNKKIGRAHV